MFVNFNILNQLGSPAINSNTFANRPAAGQTGRLFVSTDTFEIYRDNGTTWDLIGGPGSSTITGTGTATQVAYFTSSQAIGSSANLYWDNTSGFLGVGTAAPTTRIEAVKTDGIGIYSNYTTNAGIGSSATAIWAKNVTNSSGYGAVIEETTPNATAGQYPLLIKHSLSSGTAGVGMGTGVHWQLPDDAGTFKTTQLTVETIDAAAATYATRYRFNVQSNGSSTPVAYLNATGLGIFTATPGAALDIHSTGIMAQLNSTSATANSLLAFQRSGSGLWRIGDQYNGGNNFFELHNTVLTNNAIQVLASSNEATFLSSKTYSTGNAIGVAVQHNLTIPNAVNVGLAAIGGINSNLNLTLGGSTTVAATGRQGLEGSTTINFTGAGTLTMTQGSTVRAFSAISSVYAFNSSAVGTITHLAGLRICFPDNPGSAVNITNNYALLINNQTTGTGTVTYTNRWGIYQEGSLDTNYLNGTTLIGTTVNAGYKLDVSGSANATTLYENGVRVATANSVNGTTNYLPKFTSANVIGNSNLQNDTAGNLGLGIAPTNWSGTNNKAFQFGDAGAIANSGTFGTVLFNNSYYNSGYKYLTNGSASAYVQDGSTHLWYQAGSGTAGNAITFTTSMVLNTAGNLGLGVTPSPWVTASGRTALQVGVTSLSTSIGNDAFFGVNYYDDGTNNRYINSDFSLIYAQQGGNHIWYNAPSGTAGNAISFTQAMTLTNGGNFLIGTTTDAGQKLQVNGTTYQTDSLTITQADDANNLQIRLQQSSRQYWDFITSQNESLTLKPQYSTAGEIPSFIVKNSSGTNQFEINTNTSAANFAGSIKTAAPTTGTAAEWKLGSRVAAAVALDATQYIELDVGGTLYKLAIVT